ncbi:MAG: hypothetical protein R3E01_08615 [Pirellulaceae bacterium]|nr:hypothetical protein [Planctomycetales bacterium]
MTHSSSAEEYKLVSSFEAVRKTLLQDGYEDRLDKPLAYWALPNDRRLPLAFLGRSLRELLATPFNELTATRGIGQKKISSLVKLLHRATSDTAPAVPFGLSELAKEIQSRDGELRLADTAAFDPSLVSEALWVQWRDTVRRFELGDEKLGRLAPSLQSLPTVIWRTPLSEYLDRTVDEIRHMRTHGEKRVRVILEVFHAVHQLLNGGNAESHLAVRLIPNQICPVMQWVDVVCREGRIPGRDELRSELVDPLLEQIMVDSGEVVHNLACERLGINGEPKSVRVQSHEMGVTRARIYQLLEDCAKVMEVRWPEGADALGRLAKIYSSESAPAAAVTLFEATLELFYPAKGSLSAGEGADLNDAAEREPE